MVSTKQETRYDVRNQDLEEVWIIGKVEILDTNPDNICDYGFCGYKNIKQEGYKRKIDWLKKRFSEGLKYKILHSGEYGDVGLIEYIPGDQFKQMDTCLFIVYAFFIVNIKEKVMEHFYWKNAWLLTSLLYT